MLLVIGMVRDVNTERARVARRRNVCKVRTAMRAVHPPHAVGTFVPPIAVDAALPHTSNS